MKASVEKKKKKHYLLSEFMPVVSLIIHRKSVLLAIYSSYLLMNFPTKDST